MFLFSLSSFNKSQTGKKDEEKKNILYDSQNIIKSTNMSKIWIREITPIVVFHHMFESIQVSGFLKNFWSSVPNSRSNVRQSLLSGTGFSKRMI